MYYLLMDKEEYNIVNEDTLETVSSWSNLIDARKAVRDLERHVRVRPLQGELVCEE